ncbi:hypothetical protein C8Q76DRAFT_631216 [Earliella scabrosa]|nr:hypothetical protein C8Q76DRAFT_631216 [Earliella scabrosa]
MEKERGIATALLEARTAELDAAEVFLVKADDFADSEILAIVEQLNGKIFQTSASIATSPRFSYMNANHHEVEDQLFSSLGRSAQLGEPLLSALRSVNHTEDPFLVQTALQACMSAYAQWLANAWDLDSRDPHHLLHNIYSRMKEGEPQAVAGRWRSLCRSYLEPERGAPDGEADAVKHANELAKWSAEILLSCRVPGRLEVVQEAVMDASGPRLRDIAALALDFRRVTGKLMISRNFAVVASHAGAEFDRMSMEDEWADPREPSPPVAGVVVCTTQLGLVKEEKKAGSSQSIVLLRSKVVLKRALEQLLEEMA